MANKTNQYYTVDLIHIVKELLRRAWLIVLAGILAAIVGFSYSSYAIKPTYSSSIMLYVNNSSFSLGNTNFTISSSQIAAAQNLVKTYGVILKNRTTLERVIDKADVSYTYGQLAGMITSEPCNDTEIMRVTVTTEDPYEAAKIANCIAEVLPVRVAEIVDGASMEVVDSAIPNLQKVAPNITRYTILGLALGMLFTGIIIAIFAMLDDTIRDEEYILQRHGCPVLAKVPDLLASGVRYQNYYYQDKHETNQ